MAGLEGPPKQEKTRLCGAIRKRTGEPCRAPAMKNGKCYHHGGATPSGPDSPHYKTGQFTRERQRRRKELREYIRQVKANKIDARDALRAEYINTLERWDDLQEMVEADPDLSRDRALSSAATERRLAARHLFELEAALGDQAQGESGIRPVRITITGMGAVAGAGQCPEDGAGEET